jgi:hypothetical protein
MAKSSYSVRIDDNFAEDAIALTHPDNYVEGQFKEGGYVELSLSECKGDLILRVVSLANKGNRWEALVSKVVAEHLGLNSLSSKVFLSCVNSKDIELEFAMVTIKRLFLQRGDIKRFKESLSGKILYLGQMVTSEYSVQAQVQDLVKAGRVIKSGIVTSKTKIVCRSRSARIFWLVQISAEMWEFDEKGNLLFEKFLQSFVEPILEVWKEKDVSHKLSIVFFARSFYLNGPPTSTPISQSSIRSGSSGLGQSYLSDDQNPSTGLRFDDLFKVVLENFTQFDKQDIIRILKEEFWNFVRIAGWKVSPGTSLHSHLCEIAVPCAASEGNVLEAINITFNVLEKHFMDRDLLRTGNSLVMITAGTGFFKVDPKLAQITKQRMMDNGIGMDLVSLSAPPLHMVPLFYVLPRESGTGDFYEVPHWINLQYLPAGSNSRSVSGKESAKITTSNSSASLHSIASVKAKPSSHRQKPRQGHKEESKSSSEGSRLPSDICWEGPSLSNHRWTGLEQLERTEISTNLIIDGERFLIDRDSCESAAGKDSHPRKKKLHEISSLDPDNANLMVPLIADDPFFLFTAFPCPEIYSKHASLADLPQSQQLAESLCSLPRTLLKNISLQAPAPEELLDFVAVPTRGAVSFAKRSFPLAPPACPPPNRLLALLATAQVGSYDKATLLNLMSTYDKEEGTQAYVASTPVENSIVHSESLNFDPRPEEPFHGHERGAGGGSSNDYRKVTVMFPDGGGRSYMAENLSPPPQAQSLGVPAILSSSESNLHSSQSKHTQTNSLSRRSQSYSSSPGDGVVLTISPAANCSPLLSSSFKPNLMMSSSLKHPQNFPPLLHRNSSAATQQTKEGATYGSLDKCKERSRHQPLDSYRHLVNLPLSEFNKKRYGLNPFHIEEGKAFIETRTHNRRRWAHAFSSQIVEVNIATRYELNYNSLCQPAILPLSTDYFPSIEDIKNNYYTFCDYHLVLDPASPYRSPETLLVEMINQRLAQDYQLLENELVDLRQYKKFILSSDDYKDTPDHHFVALSMGHRLQFLSYIPSKGNVQVHGYMSKIGVNSEKSGASYAYKLWSQYTQAFVATSQTFHQFPQEYSWNFTDEALLGNNEDLPASSKAKRIRFAVTPLLPLTAAAAVEDYKGAVEKLLAFLGSYSDDDSLERFRVSYDEATTDAAQSEQRLKIWLAGGPKQPALSSPQWAYLVCPKTYSAHRVFHLRLEWIVCIGGLLEKLVSAIFRRFSALPLRIIEVPEYYCSSDLQVHPFRAPPIFRNSATTSNCFPPMSAVVERLLLTDLHPDWISDQRQETKWESCGVTSPSPQKVAASFAPATGAATGPNEVRNSRLRATNISGGGAYLTMRRGTRVFDKQFMHRKGYAVLRIGKDAIAWLPCSVPRVSDCQTSKEESLLVLRNFSESYARVALCLETALWILELSLKACDVVE